jgi:hypothetical protein
MSTTLAISIADRVCAAERENARSLGHDAIDVFLLAYEAWGDVFNLAFAPDRPAVHLEPRTVENRTR